MGGEEHMKVAVLKGTRSIGIESRPVPEIKADQVLVRVRAAGICGSDLHGFEGAWPDKRAVGLIMGHENTGEVAETGDEATVFKVGDRVAVDPQVPCLRCEECLQGWTHVCSNMKLLGSSARGAYDGGYAEYIAISERNLHPLPEGLSYEEGTLFDPVGNALHLVGRAELKMGDRVALFGAGTLGLCSLQVVRGAGAAETFVADLSPYRLSVAARLGADLCINSREQDPVEAILEATKGRGVDVAVEAVGKKETYQQCLQVVRKRGKIIALGNMADTIVLNLFRLVSWEVSLIGTTGFTPLEIDRVLRLMASGKFDPKPLITHSYRLEEVQDAFELLDQNVEDAIKVVLLP
jgi:L-iditol 2-dehydrogenase